MVIIPGIHLYFPAQLPPQQLIRKWRHIHPGIYLYFPPPHIHILFNNIMNNASSDFRLHSSLTEPLAPLISRHSLPQYPSLQVTLPSLAGSSLCYRLFPPRGPRNFLRDIPLANRTFIRSSANPRRPQRAQSQARSARRRRALNPRVESFSSLARALIIAILATSNLTRYWTRGKSIRSGSKFQDQLRSDRGVTFLLPSSVLAISFSVSPSRGRGCREVEGGRM